MCVRGGAGHRERDRAGTRRRTRDKESVNMRFPGSVKGKGRREAGWAAGLCVLCAGTCSWSEVSVGLAPGGSVIGEILLEEPC